MREYTHECILANLGLSKKKLKEEVQHVPRCFFLPSILICARNLFLFLNTSRYPVVFADDSFLFLLLIVSSWSNRFWCPETNSSSAAAPPFSKAEWTTTATRTRTLKWLAHAPPTTPRSCPPPTTRHHNKSPATSSKRYDKKSLVLSSPPTNSRWAPSPQKSVQRPSKTI